MRKLISYLILLGLMCCPNTQGDDVYRVVIQKQEQKQKVRWSIDEWFKTRDKMRLQDLWFALHAPSPYEFFLSAEYLHQRTEGSATWNAKASRFGFAAYASIFGLESQYETRNAYWMATFHLRIFGYHAQSTNITLNVGLRTVNNPVTYRNPYLGAEMTVNITRHAGLRFVYNHFLETISNNVGVLTDGYRMEGNGFIDYSYLRVLAGVFKEKETVRTGANADNNRWGFTLGVKLFF